jgi:hypothetical protein
MNTLIEIFIPYNVASSKNSKELVWFKRGNEKVPIFTDSKTTKNYKSKTTSYYIANSKKFREIYDSLPKPVKVGFKFYRDSKRKFDYLNPAQTVQDLMVNNNWIDDDNADCIIPIFIDYEYNKEKPGVLISIIN